MKTYIYLQKFRANLEAGEQAVILTKSGPIKIIISSICGPEIVWHDDYMEEHRVKLKDILPDHYIAWYYK